MRCGVASSEPLVEQHVAYNELSGAQQSGIRLTGAARWRCDRPGPRAGDLRACISADGYEEDARGRFKMSLKQRSMLVCVAVKAKRCQVPDNRGSSIRASIPAFRGIQSCLPNTYHHVAQYGW